METVHKDLLKEVFPKRNRDCHKGDFGRLLVVGGSFRFSGAPALNSLAAYRTGVDLVQTACPKRVADIVASFSPDIITIELDRDHFLPRHLKVLEKIDYDAVVMGGGLTRNDKTCEAVYKFLDKEEKPCVIDAEAIRAIAGDPDIIKDKPFVVTPHSFEYYILTGEEYDKNDKGMVEEFAFDLGTTILLKGRQDIISDGNSISINKTGSKYMTAGGTGDTLAGIVGSLLAQGVESYKAAQAGAYINGKAGKLVADEKKQGMIATDLIDKIPEVIS
ncbi:MAG: NAD(P)H-hydrate dehydratase [Candidatus Aenigmatarchaeota archaeon]